MVASIEVGNPETSRAASTFTAVDSASDGKKHLLLCASGSVATIKITDILSALSRHSYLSIRVLVTKSATAFLNGQSAEQRSLGTLTLIPNVDGVYVDADEWRQPWGRGNPILHIELRRWAHLMVIAPLSANTLAKIVGGLADNLLTCVVRAWDTTGAIDGGEKKRIVVAPAMNTAMWKHPVTKRHIKILEDEWGVGNEQVAKDEGNDGWFEVLRPMEKELACGDVGDGAMKDWRELVNIIETRLAL